jgi:Mn-dependent DtxR family transcriptional regulator
MRKKEREHYLKSIFMLNHSEHVENEDIFYIITKKIDKIKKDLKDLVKEGYIHPNISNPALTEKGLEIAKRLYRKHELFEDFFKNVLKVSHKEAHKLSDALEHVDSKEVEKKINEILNIRKFVPLIFLRRGDKGYFVRIEGGKKVTRRLCELGLVGNVEILVKEEAQTHGPMKISVRNSDLMLGYGEAKKVIVEVTN